MEKWGVDARECGVPRRVGDAQYFCAFNTEIWMWSCPWVAVVCRRMDAVEMWCCGGISKIVWVGGMPGAGAWTEYAKLRNCI